MPSDDSPTPSRPARVVTPSLDKELVSLGIKQYYRQLLPGREDNGQLIDLQTFDPSPSRSALMPADPTTVRLPIAISYKTWKWQPSSQRWDSQELYKWIECTFEQLCMLTANVVPSECNMFAVVLNDHPLHSIFDLDGKASLWAHLQGREEDVMASMMHWYMRFFEKLMGRAPDVRQVYWEKSSSDKKPISLHMHNVGEVFRTKRDHLEFVLRFRDYLDEQTDCILVNNTTVLAKDANERCLIDKVVYSRNRNMRLVYSCKPDGVNLVPADATLSREQALWVSLPSYSMPTDDKMYIAFMAYTRTDDEGKEIVPAKRTKSVEKAVINQATTTSSTTTSHAPQRPTLTADQVKDIVRRLDADKRVRGDRSEWLRLVWATKSAWPQDHLSEGLAFMHEVAKECAPSSKRPLRLEALWNDGTTGGFNVGTLYNMLKQDITNHEYRQLYSKHHPRRVSAQPLRSADLTGTYLVAKVNDLIAKFKAELMDSETTKGIHQLPHVAVMRWCDDNLDDVTLEQLNATPREKQRLLEASVLPFCNRFWKFILAESSYILVKQSREQPRDDRKFVWLRMTERAFTGAAHTAFRLRWAHSVKENMAYVWLRWDGRESYNGTACVPPTARFEQSPPPFLFNTWVGLRVSHERAKRDGDPNHQDCIDFRDYLWNAFLSGETADVVKTYFLLWYISQYVRPGYKLKVAVAMYSLLRQVGKSELAKIMRKQLIGDTLVVECKAKDALGDFNGQLDSMLLVCLEEYARSEQYNNNLKIALTSDVQTINKKGVNQFTQPNCCNWMIPTNHTDAINVVDFDKRVVTFLIEDGINTKLLEDGRVVKDYSLYKERQWDEVHLAAGMLAWAEELELCEWDPTKIPITEGSKLQRRCGEENHHPVAAWWRRFVEDTQRSQEVLWGEWNPTSLLHRLFQEDHSDDARTLKMWPLKSFTQEFGTRGYKKTSRRRSTAIDALCASHHVTFREDQEKVSAFKLPDRETALTDLDRVIRVDQLVVGDVE